MFYKSYTCNENANLTKNCKLKDKICSNCNRTNRSGTWKKSICKCTNCNGNHSAAYRGCHSLKYAISKLMDRQQNLS